MGEKNGRNVEGAVCVRERVIEVRKDSCIV